MGADSRADPAETLTGSVADEVVAAPLRPGDPRWVAGYQLLGHLGEGGMGTVYLARTEAGQAAALKVIRSEYARDERFLARFAHEAAAARRVARFCTAQVLDAGTDGELAFIVTEYIDGPTLAHEVARRGPMRGSTLDGLAIGVAAALHGIHSAGVVHRDLKPSNVLLSRVGPKVIDFGIARATPAGVDTGPGQVLGTPGYMAPEQYQLGRASAASDIFAWGAVMAFAGTGRHPFGDGSAYLLMHRVVDDPPDLAGLEGHLLSLVELAMQKDPARRPSARALLLDLVGEADDQAATTVALRTTWAAVQASGSPAAPGLSAAPGSPAASGSPAAPEAGESSPGTPLADHMTATAGDAAGRRRRRGLVVVGLAAAAVLALAVVSATGIWPPRGADNATPSGLVERIEIGERVPGSGYAELQLGQVDRFSFEVAAGEKLYLEGLGETCAHLLPWTLSHAAGDPVAAGVLGCPAYGPLSLTRAGRYELRVGGPNMSGKYALRLITR